MKLAYDGISNVQGESDFPIKTEVIADGFEEILQSLLEDDDGADDAEDDTDGAEGKTKS